jgi:hypothetical protein
MIIQAGGTNAIPAARLTWEGPGWYASVAVNGTSIIDCIGTRADARPRSPEGYGPMYWADTTKEALSNYAW